MEKNEGKAEPGVTRTGGHYIIPIPDQFEEPRIDYQAVFAVFFRHRWLLIFVVLFFSIASVSTALVMPRKYEASALLTFVAETADSSSLSALTSRFGGLASLAGVEFGQSDNTAEAVAVLNSRRLAIEFIQEHDLLPVIYEDLWDSERSGWAVGEEDVPSLWRASENFMEEIRKVVLRKDDGLIQLSITWQDPEVAADWVTKLTALANKLIRENAIVEADNSLSYLEERLHETREIELQQGIYRLIESYLQQKMIASVRNEYAFKTIDAAIAPDRDDYSSPKPVLFLATGVFLGTILGMVAVLWRERKERGFGPIGLDDHD